MRLSYLRNLLQLGLSCACLLGAQNAIAKERYLASNPAANGQLIFVGYKDGTSISVKDLATNFTQGYSVNKGERLAAIAAPQGRFVVETSEPLMGVLGFDCCSFSGSYFYPAIDGRKFYGKSFILSPIAQSSNSRTTILAAQDATVTFTPPAGAPISTSVTAGKAAEVSLAAGTVYTVSSTGVVAIGNNSGNGFTSVPPLPTTNPGQDCLNDSGDEFLFFTSGWATGSLAVFNSGSAGITYTVTRLSDGATVFNNVSVAAGASNYQQGLGYGAYRLKASGHVEIWSGDVEGGNSIPSMGDDTTASYGQEGLQFFINSQTQGATLFAGQDATQVTINGTPQQGSGRA